MTKTITLVPVTLSEIVSIFVVPDEGQWDCKVMYRVIDDQGDAYKTADHTFVVADLSTFADMLSQALSEINTLEGL